MQNKVEVSVIMPALNEEKNIADAIKNALDAFRRFDINGEVIVINDGSSDNTETVVRDAAKVDRRIRMVIHEMPKGVGTSFWDGLDSAFGDIIVMLPGDNENDPNEIFRYYKLLEQVDIVIPFIFNKAARPLFRNVLSLVYRFIVNTSFLVNFNYTNGTNLYRKSILKEMDYRSNGFFFQTDILIRAVKKGYLFAEVPYRVGSRGHGPSKAVTFPSLLNVINGYLHLVKDFYFRNKKDAEIRYSDDSSTAIRRRGDL